MIIFHRKLSVFYKLSCWEDGRRIGGGLEEDGRRIGEGWEENRMRIKEDGGG